MDCRNRPSLVLLLTLFVAATLPFASMLFASDDEGATSLGVPVVPGEQALDADSQDEGGEIPFEGADVFLELNNTVFASCCTVE